MAREAVHSRSPVSDFFNDAKPWYEGGVAFVRNRLCLSGVVGCPTRAQAAAQARFHAAQVSGRMGQTRVTLRVGDAL